MKKLFLLAKILGLIFLAGGMFGVGLIIMNMGSELYGAITLDTPLKIRLFILAVSSTGGALWAIAFTVILPPLKDEMQKK